jgi:hypothetical protein
MILKLNHLRSETAATTQDVTAALYALLEEERIPQDQFSRLRVHLDWIQYKHNFREAVTAARLDPDPSSDAGPPFLDLYIDTRQVAARQLGPDSHDLRCAILDAIRRAAAPAAWEDSAGDRLFLEDFTSYRNSVAWSFNSLYWRRLNEWEQATGNSYEKALPGGSSDASQPAGVADSVADFWTLLQDMDRKKQLPPEIFILELGVGAGHRCGLWLDKFKALDEQRGTKFYAKLRVLLGDFSLATLDMSRPAVKNHIDICSFMVLDAMNPLKTLSFLRHKIVYVHSANMYDNLPDEEILFRDGHFYLVQVRTYLPQPEARRIGAAFDVPPERMRTVIERMLQGSFDYLSDRARGVAFWMEVWQALRWEECMTRFENLPDSPLPAVLDVSMLEDILKGAPDDLRFHLSSGALTGFCNTLPLLHSRGYLQVQDIFVTKLNSYSMGFHGPGKLDGSMVNWVNGALLKEVAERVGFDVHFAPFRYRAGSKTSVLYTTPRE